MQINWKVRLRNPHFWVQMLFSLFTPVLAYAGITAQDLTSWALVGELLRDAAANPYVLFTIVVSVYNAIIDPTTAGIGDSQQAMNYDKPKQN